MYESGAIALALNDYAGWLGEAAVKVDRFPDDNKSTSAYVWAMAPVIRTNRLTANIGYSLATQNADSMRFVIDNPNQSAVPSSPSFDFSGRYDPYYTPSDIISHSALASVTIRPSGRATITVRGGYAFHATEDAPTFVPASASSSVGYVLQMVERKFNPWDAHMTFSSAASDAVSLSGSVDHTKTAFYSATSGRVMLTYRFLPPR
jgi:hypothetical protein